MDQSATKRKYNSQVLLGNWYEDNFSEEHKLAMYCKQKERRNLLIVKVRKLFENFLKEVPLTLRTSGLAYGDTIMIMAPDVRASPNNSNEKGVVLATTIRSKDIETIQFLIDDLNVIGSPYKIPCNRNAFIIESHDNKKPGDEVCYGDTFALKSACGSDLPMYLDLLSPSLTSPTGQCGCPNPTLKIAKSRNSRFRILHRNPQERFYSEGSPCPAFERIVISCASSNSSLCAEDEFWTLGLFSNECEISANTKLDKNKNPLIQNLWMFMGGFNS